MTLMTQKGRNGDMKTGSKSGWAKLDEEGRT